MQLNIFKGARRIVFLVQCAVVILVVFQVIDHQPPNIQLLYETHHSGDPFTLVTDKQKDCEEPDELVLPSNRLGSFRDPPGAFVVLCFRTMQSANGEAFIPIRHTIDSDAKNIWLGGDKSDPDVYEYIEQRIASFELSDETWKQITKRQNAEKLRYFAADGVPAIMVLWMLVWIASIVIGWIVRGFLDIQLGQDYRPVGTSSSHPISAEPDKG